MNTFKLDFSDSERSGVPSCPLVDAEDAKLTCRPTLMKQ